MKLYLQNIIETIQFENLPTEWQQFEFAKFSNKKTLFDYQQQSLQNALKCLYKYFVNCQSDKNKFFEFYKDNGFFNKDNGFNENLDFNINGNKKFKVFQDFSHDYPINKNKIAFAHFINRMSFWMATGSGKTLVIVKLLELLGNLIESNQVPRKDILFLTYREDLIEQFKNHIDEFNTSLNSIKIALYNLKDYEKVKRDNKLKFEKEIEVFYYRSDLISDEQKDKIVNFKNYDNSGNWYLILDEAHKGDKEDSKRQLLYSILSRNGFMFNFSATFTDSIDFATCVFNFNLERFIQNGYGKHIYLSQSNVTSLSQKDDFTEEQKQITILKILLLHTIIRKHKMSIGKYYHHPLILTLVNSVNTEDSDLELYFKELEKIANTTDTKLFNKAKKELINELNGKCEFDNQEIKIDHTFIKNLSLQDILENVFNAKTNGKIEVLKIPGNKQELVFKLTTSDKPFALIKIGDTTKWIKDKLNGNEITEKFDDESVFKNLNKDDSDISILMGSRAFYEGWDSNRPNIILYINIGKGTDARKFILQSIGRGIRIEPMQNKRKRLQFLFNNNEINKEIYKSLKDKIQFIETLFVYGTKSENLKEVIETLKEVKQEEPIGDLFEINPEVKDKSLLIPVYSESNKILAEENFVIKFEINLNDLKITENYFSYIGDKVALVKFDCQPKILYKIKDSFRKKDDFYKEDSNTVTIQKPEVILKNIIRHFSIRSKEFKEFKKLENEIIHFKQIRLTEKKREEIERKIKQLLSYKEKDKKLAEIAEKIKKEPQKANEYVKDIENISHHYVKETEVEYESEKIKLKYLQNHYYLPLALSEDDKKNYLMHIIKTKSEVDFINELEKYLEQENNFFEQFDWWFFSKIDETLDEVYIPYYQPKTNRIEKFKPDFIFWLKLKKVNRYTILFIDPKGTEHTDGYRKIDGYSRIFEKEVNGQKQSRCFQYNKFTINTKLLFKSSQVEKVPDNYKRYWFDDFDKLSCILKILLKQGKKIRRFPK